MSSFPLCQGVLTSNPDGSLTCSEQWAIIPSDQVLMAFDLAQLNPEHLAAMFGAGFTSVAICMLAGFCAAQLVKSINIGR
ncbi:hypothetical protein CFI10_09300 [Marinobacterium iners]|nr:hypothetical protein CFI10_09255 [Marinobacterium iners]QSR35190.1 hypothetical protein CFI10_09300 [Marinobacterium iners]